MDGSGTAITRSAAIGYSNIGGICSKKSYSIVEYIGFNNMQNAAHELGHRYCIELYYDHDSDCFNFKIKLRGGTRWNWSCDKLSSIIKLHNESSGWTLPR